jgi:hypothetical protein
MRKLTIAIALTAVAAVGGGVAPAQAAPAGTCSASSLRAAARIGAREQLGACLGTMLGITDGELSTVAVRGGSRLLDPILCPIFASWSPGVPGVIDILPNGDIWIAGEQFWECPPYSD